VRSETDDAARTEEYCLPAALIEVQRSASALHGQTDGNCMPSLNKTQLPWWAAPYGFRWFAPSLLIGVLVGLLGVAGSKYAHRHTHATQLLLFVVGPIGLIGSVLLCVGWKSLLKASDARARQLE
jgi:hypothetical protein